MCMPVNTACRVYECICGYKVRNICALWWWWGALRSSGALPIPRFLSLLRSGGALPVLGIGRWSPNALVAVRADLQAAGGSRGKRRPKGWGGAGRQAGRGSL